MSWRAGSPMKAATVSSSTASGSRGRQPRLIDCPRCGVRVVKIRSKQKETFDQVFYKCPNNIREDQTTCRFIRSEEQYEMYVRALDAKQEHIVEAVDEGRSFGDGMGDMKWHQYLELKQEITEMKQQLGMALCEIWNLKMQRSEVKEEKKAFGMSISVAIAGCIGLVVGLFVTTMWK